MPPQRPLENLPSPRIESKADTSPRIDLEFKEIHHTKKKYYLKHSKDQINHIFKNKRIRKFSKYRQASTKSLTEAD